MQKYPMQRAKDPIAVPNDDFTSASKSKIHMLGKG